MMFRAVDCSAILPRKDGYITATICGINYKFQYDNDASRDAALLAAYESWNQAEMAEGFEWVTVQGYNT